MSNQTSDLQYVADGWQPWMTPKGFYQALQQGGLFVFQGEQLAFSHFDQASVLKPLLGCKAPNFLERL